jgi:hypothetical protein
VSFFKRIRKRVSAVAKKAEHLAIKASTPGLSHKTEKKIEHAVDKAHGIQNRLGKAALHPTAHNVARAIPGLSEKKEARLEHTLKVGRKFEGAVGRELLHPTTARGREVKHQAKTVTRNIARSTAKETVYAVGGITAVVSYFFTPVAGAAVGAGLSGASYYVGSTAARAKGIHGRAARHAGRVERKKAATAAIIGMSIGAAGAGVAAAAGAGATVAGGAGSGAAGIVGAGNVSTVSSIGGVVLGAGQRIVSYEQQRAAAGRASSSPTAGITLDLSGSQVQGNQAPSSPASSSPVPWVPIALALGGVAIATA